MSYILAIIRQVQRPFFIQKIKINFENKRKQMKINGKRFDWFALNQNTGIKNNRNLESQLIIQQTLEGSTSIN